MSRRFFELADDMSLPHRWDLDAPTDSQGLKLDDGQFKLGTPVHIKERLKIAVEIAGKPLLMELAPDDVQLLPVDVAGQTDPYFILVATRLIRCIDEQRSRVRRWTQEDGLPDMVGQYASVRDMRIDKSTVGNAQVFRPDEWFVSLIVSEEIKDALDRMGATGTRFEEV